MGINANSISRASQQQKNTQHEDFRLLEEHLGQFDIKDWLFIIKLQSVQWIFVWLIIALYAPLYLYLTITVFHEYFLIWIIIIAFIPIYIGMIFLCSITTIAMDWLMMPNRSVVVRHFLFPIKNDHYFTIIWDIEWHIPAALFPVFEIWKNYFKNGCRWPFDPHVARAGSAPDNSRPGKAYIRPTRKAASAHKARSQQTVESKRRPWHRTARDWLVSRM